MINGWGILGVILLIAAFVFAILGSREKGITFAVATYISIVVAVSCIAAAIIGPLMAKRNIIRHEALEMTVKIGGPVIGYDEFEDSVNKSNEWLAEANKELNTYGIFSMYYGSNLEDLEYIVIPEQEE